MAELCRSCQAPIIWLEHATTGKPAPIDVEPVPDGNIRIGVAFEHYTVLSGNELQDAIDRGDELHFNHFATCPQAYAWKGRSRAGAP